MLSISWLFIWLGFWIIVLGGTNFLFKKYQITYYKYSWQHTLFFIISLLLLCVVYKPLFVNYFLLPYQTLSSSLIFIFFSWIFIPLSFKKDYFSKKERIAYQVPKFFEVLFQQLCFLGGLLTFGVSPVIFSLVFFVIHLPLAFFIPKKFAFVFTLGSSVGGLIFAFLQKTGPLGFLISLSVHLIFYLAFHLFITIKSDSKDEIHKR